MNMDKKEHLRLFNNYYYVYVKGELEDDLRKLKNIEDVVKKYQEVHRIVNKYKPKESNMNYHYNGLKSNTIEDGKYYSILKKFSEKICQLEKTKNELAKTDEVKKDIEKKEI